jgi:hypothetical protein
LIFRRKYCRLPPETQKEVKLCALFFFFGFSGFTFAENFTTMGRNLTKEREMAYILYMAGSSLTSISQKIGVSPQALTRWCAADRWKERRAARNITRPELVNKMLRAVDRIIDQVNTDDVPVIDGDKLAKLAAAIKNLDKSVTVVDVMEVLQSFGAWLEERSATDPKITAAFMAEVNRYQDIYVSEKMSM